MTEEEVKEMLKKRDEKKKAALSKSLDELKAL